MKFLDGLNGAQRRAATAADGPVMIVAGPGTGKTGTLAARVAWLLASGWARPDEVVALTFTAKAAAQMRERVARLLGEGMAAPEIVTFHALSLRLLGDVSAARRLVRDDEQAEIIRGLERPKELAGLGVRELVLRLSRHKNRVASEAEADEPLGRLAAAYGRVLGERGAWDFDDVLAEALARVLEDGRGAYAQVLVDEFQDTSEVQYALARALAGAENLFVIGDPRQSIYGFRGAGGAMFERFATDFPGHAAVTLTTNYRSARDIVAVGNAVFPEAPDLVAASGERGRVRLVQTLGEHGEAAWIVGEIAAGLGGTDLLQADASVPVGRSFRDYAVIYRTHRLGRAVRQRLSESGLPFQVAGEGSPYERPAVAGVVVGLRELAAGGEAWRGLSERVPPSELARRIAAQLGLDLDDQEVRQDLAQLVATLTRFDSDADGLARAVRYLDELAQSEFYDPAAEAVTLLTIHAAKGLEFAHVFVCGVEEGLLPHYRPGAAADMEEERRLFYVAATRAKEWLDLTYTKGRGGQSVRLSRFAAELRVPELQRLTDPAMDGQERKRERRRQERRQGTLF